MTKISPDDMHLLVLVTENPRHPSVPKILRGLEPDARAVAIGMLRGLDALPGGSTRHSVDERRAAEDPEIGAAVDEFLKLSRAQARARNTRRRATLDGLAEVAHLGSLFA